MNKQEWNLLKVSFEELGDLSRQKVHIIKNIFGTIWCITALHPIIAHCHLCASGETTSVIERCRCGLVNFGEREPKSKAETEEVYKRCQRGTRA